MKRAGLTLLATMMLLVMMALSSTVALAGWVYEDCPPASSVGELNRSEQASLKVGGLLPPDGANEHAWEAENPGNKYR